MGKLFIDICKSTSCPTPARGGRNKMEASDSKQLGDTSAPSKQLGDTSAPRWRPTCRVQLTAHSDLGHLHHSGAESWRIKGDQPGR